MWGVGACCSTWLFYAWGRVKFVCGCFLDSFPRSCSLELCLCATLGVLFHILLPILVRHVFCESTFIADFLANWACSNWVSRIFSLLKIFLQAYLVLYVWMRWLFLTLDASIDGFPFPFAVFIRFWLFACFFSYPWRFWFMSLSLCICFILWFILRVRIPPNPLPFCGFQLKKKYPTKCKQSTLIKGLPNDLLINTRKCIFNKG